MRAWCSLPIGLMRDVSARRSFALLAMVAAAFIAIHAMLVLSTFAEDEPPSFACRAAEVGLYLAAVALVLRDRTTGAASGRRAAWLIVGVAVILRLMMLFAPPESTDVNRYVWDGRVQAAGISPYRYVPADPALKFLRDDEIYPEINRADYAPTIYPPLAQIVFLLVTRVSESVGAMKVAMVLFEGLAAWALLQLLEARGKPSRNILLYAWHPLPIWEFAGSGHVDAVAVACVAIALLAAQARRPAWAGVALGGAALVKFFPVIIGPALYRRWGWRLPLAGAATLVLLYLPYLIGAGGRVFGFLFGYSEEEGLSDGSGLYLWLLLGRLFPTSPEGFRIVLPVAALLLGALGLKILLRRAANGVDLGGALLLAESLAAVTSPHYAWYFTWLVPFLPFVRSGAALYLTCGSTLIYRVGWPPSFVGGTILYAPFLVLLAADFARLTPWRRPPTEANAPVL